MKVSKRALQAAEKRLWAKGLRQAAEEVATTARRTGVKAVHQVFTKGTMGEILKGGFILPGIYRLDPDWIRVSCGKWMNELRLENPKGKEEIYPALEALVERALAEVKKFRVEHRIRTVGAKTRLECVDILFGDAWNVFLSPHGGRFAESYGEIVYDAYALVERGAALRREDFIYGYKNMLWDLFHGKTAYEDLEPVDRILAAAKDVWATELTGGEALQELDGMAINLDSNPDADIVWNGPLPVEWATQIR